MINDTINKKLPLVSIIVPCRNEKKYVKSCLDSFLNQDYPKNKIEVLVIDGMSEDDTKEIVGECFKKYPFIKFFDNPKKYTSFAFNIGIKESKGDFIVIGGAHSIYDKDYISKCVKYSLKYDADNVGGVIRTKAISDSLVAKAIAFCLSSFFGVGDSYFRTGSEKPRWVDTVFGGCYKRKVFERIGFFNEKLIRSSDMEFNLRLKRAGGKILLVPDIISYYYPKDNLKDFFLHNIRDGIWAILPLKFTKIPLKLRHYIPLIFILTLPISIWLYIPVSLYFSLKIAFQQKNWRYFFIMPIVFAVRHIGYGVGSVWGFVKLLV